MYVDNLLTGGATVEEVHTKKQIASAIFNDGKFTLHKWHSNAKELESNKDPTESVDQLSYAKQQLGTTLSETKMLGMPWDKQSNTIKVVFSREPAKCTKREVLLGICLPNCFARQLTKYSFTIEKIGFYLSFPKTQTQTVQFSAHMP